MLSVAPGMKHGFDMALYPIEHVLGMTMFDGMLYILCHDPACFSRFRAKEASGLQADFQAAGGGWWVRALLKPDYATGVF